MTEEIKEQIKELNEKLDRLMDFIVSTDKIPNLQLCDELGISDQTLYNWFKKGCPRIDNRHVSRSNVKKWAAENSRHRTSK